jgi:hypothetical protein
MSNATISTGLTVLMLMYYVHVVQLPGRFYESVVFQRQIKTCRQIT